MTPSMTEIQMFGAIGAFLLQFGVIIWRLSKIESGIHSRIDNVEYNGELENQKLRNEIIQTQLNVARDYVRKDSFEGVANNIDARLIRLEGKLDTVIANRK